MRGFLGIILALQMAACGMFADRPRPAAAPPALASVADQPAAAATTGQYAGVEVSWEDRADLRSPAQEANMLSETIMAELQKRDMSHSQAEQSLQVRIMEVLLRPGGRMKTGSSVLNARVYVLAADGSEAWNFPQRTSLTVTARSSQTVEQQLAALYQRFAQQLADSLQQRAAN